MADSDPGSGFTDLGHLTPKVRKQKIMSLRLSKIFIQYNFRYRALDPNLTKPDPKPYHWIETIVHHDGEKVNNHHQAKKYRKLVFHHH